MPLCMVHHEADVEKLARTVHARWGAQEGRFRLHATTSLPNEPRLADMTLARASQRKWHSAPDAPSTPARACSTKKSSTKLYEFNMDAGGWSSIATRRPGCAPDGGQCPNHSRCNPSAGAARSSAKVAHAPATWSKDRPPM